MAVARRLGGVTLLVAGTWVVACGVHPGAARVGPGQRGKAAPARTAEVTDARSEADDARAPAAMGATPATPDTAPVAPSTPLTTFVSKEDLVRYLREAKLVRPAPPPGSSLSASGNMWGDAIGDAFGAGGLGLSGVGEGGGGVGEGIGLGSVGTLGHGAGTGASSAGSGPSSNGGPTSASITNTQHVGVDEGGIVKVRGEHLVVLRRGRLFTVRLGDLTPVSTVDAFGTGIDPLGAWYDELLVTSDTIVVIGYSYARGGTEIGLFDLDTAGHITSRATYHMRADDYYSSRNYASRLIGDKLVFYSPLYINADERDPLRWMPALRRWKNGAKESDFAAIIQPSQIQRPLDPSSDGEALTLHTVTTCDVGKRVPPAPSSGPVPAARASGPMTCTARAVMGPPGRVFYVSPEAVYVWMTPRTPRGPGERAPASLLYRLPLDPKEEARVQRTRGAPIDQFSFLERDGHLNVVVRAGATGDAMWSPEVTSGAIAMLRVPVASFTSRAETVPSSAYLALPEARGSVMHNRFVGDHLLYGVGSGWGRPTKPADARVFVHRYAGRTPPAALALGHGVDRIEPMGEDAIVVGTDGADLGFTSIALDPKVPPALGARYTRKNASQGELRSHGFFYRDDGDRNGIVGLPVRGGDAPGYSHLLSSSASVLYLQRDRLRLRELGSLAARAGAPADDRCRTSCVDWYGNARPLFVQNRVLALMGYELVEGRLDAGRLSVDRRATFAPR